MKKLFLLIAVVLITSGALHYYFKNNEESAVVPGNVIDKTFRPDPNSATFKFDDRSVTLSNGKSVEEYDAGFTEEVMLLEENAYGDLNNDGEEDSVVLLARLGGGSGVFVYAAAYVSGPVSYKGSNAVFLGDRVAPQSVSISNGIATIKFLDRNPDEALASDPSVPTTKQFIYRNGEFVER